MLKTSPILSSSPNASPANFRNAPSRSPKESPRLASSKHRRPSSRPISSPGPSINLSTKPSAPHIAGLSAGTTDTTQHSTTRATAALETPQASASTLQQPLPNPPVRPHTQAMTAESAAAPGQTSAKTTPPGAEAALSPNKRRGSPGEGPSKQIDLSAVPTSPAAPSPKTAKRAKPDEQPPKVLPQRYELCAVEDIVELIAHMLAELISTNDAIRISSGGLTRFHSRTPPGISVRDYLHRLAKHATLTPPLLLAMVYYIDRLCALYQEFTINTLTVHRFLITAATVAAKGLSDSFWNNTTYARVGGVRIAELKMLELEFLYRVDWKIVPNPEVLVAYYQGLVERTPEYALEFEESSSDDIGDDDE